MSREEQLKGTLSLILPGLIKKLNTFNKSQDVKDIDIRLLKSLKTTYRLLDELRCNSDFQKWLKKK